MKNKSSPLYVYSNLNKPQRVIGYVRKTIKKYPAKYPVAIASSFLRRSNNETPNNEGHTCTGNPGALQTHTVFAIGWVPTL